MWIKLRVLVFCVVAFIIIALLHYLREGPQLNSTIKALANNNYIEIFTKNADTTNDITYRTSVLKYNRSHSWPEWTYKYSLHPWLYNSTRDSGEHNEADLCMPKAIGIGVKKCGTSALQYFMQAHPKFKILPGNMEGHFFDSARFERGIHYYRSRMPKCSKGDIVFEKSPRYFITAKAVSRIREWNPDIKIIVILCDPVLRAYSDYNFMTTIAPLYRKRLMDNFTSFDQYLSSAISDLKAIEKDPYGTLGYGTYHAFVRNAWNERTFALTALTNGLYAEHLLDWFTFFPRNQIHIVNGEQLITDPITVLRNLQLFLNLEVLINRDDIYYHNKRGFYCLRTIPCLGIKKGLTRGVGVKKMSVFAQRQLTEFYQLYNEKLFYLLQRKFEWL